MVRFRHIDSDRLTHDRLGCVSHIFICAQKTMSDSFACELATVLCRHTKLNLPSCLKWCFSSTALLLCHFCRFAEDKRTKLYIPQHISIPMRCLHLKELKSVWLYMDNLGQWMALMLVLLVKRYHTDLIKSPKRVTLNRMESTCTFSQLVCSIGWTVKSRHRVFGHSE